MIQVSFMNGSKEATSTPLYQWDYGQELHIYGLDFSNAVIQVHFCDKSCQRTFVRLATLDYDHYKVSIPDGLLENVFSISAFVYVKTDTSGKTTHHITIPVVPRKKPDSFISQPDESQSSQLDKALNDINEANTRLVQTAEGIAGTVNDLDQSIAELGREVDDNATVIANLKTSTSTLTDDVSDMKSKIGKMSLTENKVSVTGLYTITAMCTTAGPNMEDCFSETIYIHNINTDIMGKYFKYNCATHDFSVVESPYGNDTTSYINAVFSLIKDE